ncbi:hypothetical protein IHC92_20560 [Photobacterium damselae subsp. damselae]|uniref:hypothetical protein n=1 Tax=Photobacterium damselae TaxID=38293 RepID=UPI001F1DD5B3|nr:hypothetical protein [Photobacterium damselae]UKA23346.1 hypothetical protein IHC92_20560 [Photobacterium damselae subsp. damselae]
MITLQKNSPVGNAMENAIKRIYPNDYYQVGDLTWLISDDKAITPQDVANSLGDGDIEKTNQMGLHLITVFNGYWGFHDSSMWEWIRARGL